MTADARPWRSIAHLVVPHPAEPAVLVEELGHTRRLPRAEAAERVWFVQLGRVSELAAERLGSPYTALRYLDFRTDGASGTPRRSQRRSAPSPRCRRHWPASVICCWPRGAPTAH